MCCSIRVIRPEDGLDQPPLTQPEDASLPTLSAGDASDMPRLGRWEVIAAVAIFVVFCAVVLVKSPQLLEPDDYAYRAAIVALTHGNVTLTNNEYQALATQLDSGTPSTGMPSGLDGQSIMQWVRLANGSWISEKNPGYPFLAAPFQALGILRAAPLFYGALACFALFTGVRRWLGRWSGTWAVGFFLGSGAAMVFAWRSTMPTFTDASLIAAGVGALMWTALSVDRSSRARIATGLLGLIALETAVAIRYTNAVFLVVALVAMLLSARRCGLPRTSWPWWFGSVAVLAGFVLWFNQTFYGNPFSTGYSTGVVTFSLGSVIPNLTIMPLLLVRSAPMVVLALAALIWMLGRFARRRNDPSVELSGIVRRDAALGLAMAAAWFGLWGMYLAYDWTARMGAGDRSGGLHLIRFYLPALGVIAVLATWLVKQLPGWVAPVSVVGLFALGILTFQLLAADGPGGPSGPGGPGDGPPGVGVGPGAPPPNSP